MYVTVTFFSWSSDFASQRLFDGWVIFSDNETGWPRFWPQNKCRSIWPLFHGLVIFLNIFKCIDNGYLVSATLYTILYQSFWNFIHVFSMEMYVCFGYNPWINFSHVFHFVNFVISMKVYRQWVPCECNFSYNFIPIYMQLCTSFIHGLMMCM